MDEPRAANGARPAPFTSTRILSIGATLAMAVLLASTGCQKRQASGAWEIVPGQRIGLMNRTESEIDLQMGYGAQNVRRADIPIGEGETLPGSVIFPDDSTRRLEVLWHDPANHRYPAYAILRGEKSLWQLPHTVTLGTTLHELEEWNGRPFLLAGFGWDYAGVVLSWNGGALDSLLGQDTKLYLTPPPSERPDSLYAQAMGDRPFSSSSHPMRAMNPKVYRIQVEFGPPAAVTDSTAPSIGDTAATESLVTQTSGRGASPLEIREDDNGQTFTYPVSTRFTVTLDERKYPGHTLVIDPEGIVGRVASVPSVDPPLYAVRFEAARPGRATIRSRGFLITVVVTETSAKPQ